MMSPAIDNRFLAKCDALKIALTICILQRSDGGRRDDDAAQRPSACLYLCRRAACGSLDWTKDSKLHLPKSKNTLERRL
jgi:hypothetical protein